MRRKRLRANERRAQILDVATNLFDANGYHSTTLEDIASGVGIVKASLYYYFKSKEDLLVALHEDMMLMLLRRQADHVGNDDLDREAKLRGIVQDIIGLMESHPGRLRIFFEAYRELPASTQEAISKQRLEYRNVITNLVAEGIRAGEFRDCDAELASLAILGMCNWTYQWYKASGRLKTDEIADEFNAFITSALRR